MTQPVRIVSELPSSGKRTRDSLLVALLTALPVCFFYWFFWKQVVNVPFQDDFDGTIGPVLTLAQGNPSLADSWATYWTQDDERRIVANRFVAHAQYLLTGQYNLRTHTLAGSLLILLVLGTFGLWFRQSRLSWWLFLPVPFILFNPQYFDAIQWAQISWQQIGVFVWALLSVWCITRQRRLGFALALVFALFSLLSDVTGLLAFVVGGILLLAQQRWQRLLVWGAVASVSLGLYFYGLEVPAFRPPLADNLRLPGTMLQVWVSMQGLWLNLAPRLPFAVQVGICLVAGSAAIWLWVSSFWRSGVAYWKRQQVPDRQLLFLYGGLLIFLGAYTLFTLGRAVEGVQATFLSRYRIMYVCWLALLYLLALQRMPARWLKQTRVVGLLVAMGVGYGLTAWFQYAGLAQDFRQTLLTDLHGWKHHRVIPSSPIYEMHRHTIDDWMEKAQEQGIFTYENDALERFANAPVVGKAKVDVSESAERVSFALLEAPTPTVSPAAEVYVLLRQRTPDLKGQQVPMILATTPTRTSLLTWLRTGKYASTPYHASAQLKRYLTDANPEVEIGVIDQGRLLRYKTGQKPSLSLPLRQQ